MNWLFQILGIAAMGGGALRMADSFTTRFFSSSALAVLYFVTDLLLLLGIAGIYWSRKSSLGVAGTIGIAVFVVGILLVRMSAFSVLGPSGYQIGATIAVLGLATLSAEALLKWNGSRLASALWLAALALGAGGTIGIMPAATTMLAGVAFGAGFIVAGAETFASRSVGR